MPNTEPTLAAGDVGSLTGLGNVSLHDWCRLGVVKEVAGGGGRGRHRRFALSSVIGMAAAVWLRESERGSSVKFSTRVVGAFEKMGMVSIEREVESGARYFTGEVLKNGLPELTEEKRDGWMDVKEMVQKMRKITG